MFVLCTIVLSMTMRQSAGYRTFNQVLSSISKYFYYCLNVCNEQQSIKLRIYFYFDSFLWLPACRDQDQVNETRKSVIKHFCHQTVSLILLPHPPTLLAQKAFVQTVLGFCKAPYQDNLVGSSQPQITMEKLAMDKMPNCIGRLQYFSTDYFRQNKVSIAALVLILHQYIYRYILQITQSIILLLYFQCFQKFKKERVLGFILFLLFLPIMLPGDRSALIDGSRAQTNS